MSADITLKAIGLNTQPNQLDPQSVPPGSLLEASNVIIRRDNVIESRRGYKLYGTPFGTSTDRAKQLMTYKDRIIRHFSDELQYDTLQLNSLGQSIFDTFCGTYLEPQVGRRIRYIESNGNLYFTTSAGVQVISAKTAADFTTACPFIQQAGGIAALDLSARLDIILGNESGFLPQDSAVSYRQVWGFNDANGNEVLGAPSQSVTIFNPLINLELLDFNNLLIQLDNVSNATPVSLINDANYYALLNLPQNASPQELLTNLISLSAKIDNDILYADQVAVAPLQIDGAAINGTVATMNFSSGDPSQYFISGDDINLAGFTTSVGTINGEQTISTLFPAFATTGTTTTGAFQTTQVTTVADVSNSLAGTYFTINSANNVTQYYVWYSVSGNGFAPPLSGFTGIQVNIATNDTAATVALNTGVAITAIAGSDFTTGVLSNVLTITNSAQGAATPATPATSGFAIVTTLGGVAGNVITAIANINGINVGAFIYGGGIPIGSYVTNIGIGTITISNDVTSNNVNEPLTFDAGFNFNISATPATTTSPAVPLAVGPVITLNATINSFNYESITQPAVPGTPAADQELVALQTYLQAIITQLQSEPSTGTPPVISTASQAAFITPLQLTTTANVFLTFTIPAGVTTSDFYQIYRSQIVSATGASSIQDIAPNDELQLVFEGFPTAAQIAAGTITVLDITPQSFAGAFLYTNATTGEGILQANDTPPFALDINKFKNVLFYANTATKFQQLINLLGLSNIISDFNNLIVSTITNISVGNPTTITTSTPHGLVTGDIVSILESNSTPSVNGSWTVTVTGANTFTIPVDVTVAGNTGTVYSGFPSITITNGITSSTYTFVLGVNQVINVATVADVAGSLAGKYFTLWDANNAVEYYVWYIVSGVGTDPAPAGMTGIPVNINTNDSANTVALKTSNTLNVYSFDFVATSSTNNVMITNANEGIANDPTPGTSGFTTTVVTPGNGANPALNQILLSNLVSPAQAVDQAARSLVNIINSNPNESVYAFYITGVNGVPGQIELQSRDLSTLPFYILANDANVGSSFSPSISPQGFITNISVATQAVVTTATINGLISGEQVVISGSNSTPSIDGLYTITVLSPTTFSIPVTTTIAGNSGAYSPALDTLTATQNGQENRIYYSKLLQPEAVPAVNFIDVGAQDKAILRIFPMIDSLFVYKEDGLYRISGEVAPFNLALFDTSCILLAPDSLDISNNLIYGWTRQGVQTTSESGVITISRPIDVDILPLATTQYANFKAATWGIGYESDNSYTVYTVQATDDLYATIAYRYSTLTNTWTTFAKTDNCGVINFIDDTQYLGAGDVNFLEMERKNFNRTDYADREFAEQLTINSYFGTQIQLSDISNIAIGDVITQDQQVSIYTFNNLLEKLDTDVFLSPHTYVLNNTFLPGADPRLQLDQLITQIANDPGRLSQGGHLPPSSYTQWETISGSFDIINIAAGDPTVITTGSPNGLETGRIITITGSNSLPIIDGTYPVTVLSPTTFTIPFAVTQAGIPLLAQNSGAQTTHNLLTNSVGSNLIAQNFIPADTDIVDQATFSLSYDTNPLTGTAVAVLYSDVAGSPGVILDTSTPLNLSTLTASPANYMFTFTGGVVVDAETVYHIALNTSSAVLGSSNGVDIYESAPNGIYTSVQIYNGTNWITTSGKAIIFSLNSNSVGSFSVNNEDFEDILASYNGLINTLNDDNGIQFANYNTITNDTLQEALVTATNSLNHRITLNNALPFMIGPLTLYKAIDSEVTWSPVTFNDPLMIKHVREAQLLFENRAFTNATLSFSTDLLPGFINIPFLGTGNGIFGYTGIPASVNGIPGPTGFGYGYFGGASDSTPFRTYIPSQAQRCRFLNVKFNHTAAREQYAIFGLTLTQNDGAQSSRGYR
jgi:hypothetical protein